VSGGPATDRELFVNFVRNYMHSDLHTPLACPSDARVTDYADWLYLYVRCGLAHAFALEWGHIESFRLGSYIRLSATGQPQINQDELVDDFARGWNRFLIAVAGAPADQISLQFAHRFDEVFHD